MKPQRILILSASAGAGHMRAAEAIEAACRRRDPRAHVQHVDVLTLTPPAFRTLYVDAYLDLVNRAPAVVGIVYDRTNRPPRHRAAEVVRQAVERLNTRRLAAFIRDFAPDILVHTHFLPAEIAAHEKRRGRLAVPQAVVVTDFDVHRFWCGTGIDRFFVAREDNRLELVAQGVAAANVRVTGIPVHPVFGEDMDRGQLLRKHGIAATEPLLLLLTGGFGTGPVEGLLRALWARLEGTQIAVVAGRNEALRARLERAAKDAPLPTRVLGFTREMHEWLCLASLVVTKPGGLTISEALARGRPLVVANAIPGQETRNATMLYEEGAAISGENPHTVGARVARLLADPRRLASMAEAAHRLGRPRAAFEVAEELAALQARA